MQTLLAAFNDGNFPPSSSCLPCLRPLSYRPNAFLPLDCYGTAQPLIPLDARTKGYNVWDIFLVSMRLGPVIGLRLRWCSNRINPGYRNKVAPVILKGL